MTSFMDFDRIHFHFCIISPFEQSLFYFKWVFMTFILSFFILNYVKLCERFVSELRYKVVIKWTIAVSACNGRRMVILFNILMAGFVRQSFDKYLQQSVVVLLSTHSILNESVRRLFHNIWECGRNFIVRTINGYGISNSSVHAQWISTKMHTIFFVFFFKLQTILQAVLQQC